SGLRFAPSGLQLSCVELLNDLDRSPASKTPDHAVIEVQIQHGRSDQVARQNLAYPYVRCTFAVCRIIGYAVGLNLKLQPASKSPRLPDKKIARPPHWRAAKTVSHVAEARRGKAAVGGDEIARGKETGHEVHLDGVGPRNYDGLGSCARTAR